jgi:hypothetical protein
MFKPSFLEPIEFIMLNKPLAVIILENGFFWVIRERLV